MNAYRKHLPFLLLASGVATSIAFVLSALLSLANPITAVTLLVSGFAIGAGVSGFGLHLEHQARIEAHLAQMKADTRAQTEATLAMARAVREASAD